MPELIFIFRSYKMEENTLYATKYCEMFLGFKILFFL
jgi:hypothetical protein